MNYYTVKTLPLTLNLHNNDCVSKHINYLAFYLLNLKMSFPQSDCPASFPAQKSGVLWEFDK